MSCQDRPEEDTKFYALEEYKLAVQLTMYQSKMFWDVFNIFLVLNSGLLAVLGILLREGVSSFRFVLPLALTGCTVCIFWFFVLGRSKAYQSYYIFRTRELRTKLGFEVLSPERYEQFFKKQHFYAKFPTTTIALFVPIVLFLVWILILAMNFPSN